MQQKWEGNGALRISVEGLDGSGKTTLIYQLAAHFKTDSRHIPVHVFSFPDRSTDIGKLIDKVLRKEIVMDPITLQFLFSANRSEMQAKIKEATGIVLFDRYLDSAVAYASAQGIDGKWIRTLDSACIKPTLYLFLHAEPKIALARIKKGAELYDRLHFQECVHAGYMECYSGSGQFKLPGLGENFCRLDAGETQEEVFKSALGFLEGFI